MAELNLTLHCKNCGYVVEKDEAGKLIHIYGEAVCPAGFDTVAELESVATKAPERLHILSPTDLKPGSTSPAGRVIQKATMYTNEAAGYVIVSVEYDGAKQSNLDVFTWPLAKGWTVGGVTA